MFRRLGSEVTILEQGEQLAEHEDQDVSDEIAKILREDRIEILLQTPAMRCSKAPDGLRLSIHESNTTRELAGSHLLIAVGRTPNTEALHVERAGVKLDAKGFVQCNSRLETTAAGIYAIGDVKGGPEFTHISYDDFRVLRTNLLEDGNRTIDGRPLPYTLFLDPELGRIGLTETAARKSGKNIKVAKVPATSIARAVETGESRGFLKAIVDRDTDLILGASMLVENGGELSAQIQIAMMGNVTASALRDGIWSHPTWSEALNTLFSTYVDDRK
ncbi:MAG: FAD-dependent oxidoreductase [Acidobacteriota bacterium]|nr:FAD-dependent oxidoreductase [Acidobacteriota bacterium]